MAPSKAILTIGLAHAPPATQIAVMRELGITPNSIGPLVQKSSQDARDAGFDIESLFISPAELDATIEKVNTKIQERKWDGVLIGFGVRGSPEYTVAFEKVTDLLRVKCPEVRVGFTARPDDIFDAVKRNFGE